MWGFLLLTLGLASAGNYDSVQVSQLPLPTPRVILHVGGYHAEEAGGYANIVGDRVVFIESMPEVHRVCERTAARYGQACLNYLFWDEDSAQIYLQVTMASEDCAQNSVVSELAAGIEQFPEVRRATDSGKLRLIASRLDVLMAKPSSILRHNYTDVVINVYGVELQVLRGMGTLLTELPIERAVIETSTASMHGNQALHEKVLYVMQSVGFMCVEG